MLRKGTLGDGMAFSIIALGITIVNMNKTTFSIATLSIT
jgi:hypothetical protein